MAVRRTRSILLWSLVTSLALAVVPASSSAQASSITFLLPSAGNQPEPDPGPPTDKLVYTGGPITTGDVTGCAVGARPMQTAVLVDPGGHRGSGTVTVISLSETEPVRPGTRVTQIRLTGACSVWRRSVQDVQRRDRMIEDDEQPALAPRRAVRT